MSSLLSQDTLYPANHHLVKRGLGQCGTLSVNKLPSHLGFQWTSYTHFGLLVSSSLFMCRQSTMIILEAGVVTQGTRGENGWLVPFRGCMIERILLTGFSSL